MRSELEATHGHRLTAVLIDKAIQWQERTMRVKWLWQTWAYLGLVLVIAGEVFSLWFTLVFIVPKFRKLLREGLVDPAVITEQGFDWATSFVFDFQRVTEDNTGLLVVVPLATWGLFEWRVRGENKSLMRLSALGTVATVLVVMLFLTVATLMVGFCLGVPATGKVATLYAKDQVATIDASVAGLEQARAKQDWAALQDHATRAAAALAQLAEHPSAIPTLRPANDAIADDELRAAIAAARGHVGEAQQAIRDKDAAKLAAALKRFRKAYEPVSAAAKRAAK